MNKLKLAVSILALSAASASAEDIKIGLISILEGNFAVSGTDAIRGAELAILDVEGSVDGNKIEMVSMSSDGSPDTAVAAARKLIEQDGVDIILGPLSGSEGLALRDLSKSYPNVTFINGSSAAQDTTLRQSSDNFFRFGGDGAQWMVGVGDYAFNDLGYKSVAVVAEDYSFPYTQVLGFMSEFCAAGGTVPEKFWTPIGNSDYSSVVYAIPQDVDAIFVALGGADAVNFLTQYDQAGGDKPIIGGSTTIDQSILESKGPFKKLLIGAPAGSPTVGDYDGAEWQAFVKAYTTNYPDAFSAPSIFAHHYYMAATAALLALDEVDGDLSNDHAAYREALTNLSFTVPTGGTMRLDANRNGIVDNFVTEVYEREDGTLGNRVIKVVRDVSQSLGQDPEAFLAMGPVSRDNPSCP
ncbi:MULTISPECIES: ABC transporter substrate-binding protein [Pacificibacter]|uniref:ABC transporter substrate-binding protein n=1 Tax=Pacificibacter TaxID=1042323 RepID=UPI001C096DD6|nr:MULTISPECIES: ABC transporter substrate-binding protein [Pacificibacter]MBU2936376.1 ABC transporter substrate-binding protein [Pacificibacter marinus]MDO6617341.1 ABC transporter substrate-binding protein [Pacificibacter sp. 1_MG-2023]